MMFLRLFIGATLPLPISLASFFSRNSFYQFNVPGQTTVILYKDSPSIMLAYMSMKRVRM